jgi:hypothetical protein
MDLIQISKVRKVFVFVLIFLSLFSMATFFLNSENTHNSEVEYCDINIRSFINQDRISKFNNVTISPKDIYIFPEVHNIFCIGKIIEVNTEENNLAISYGSNPKLKIVILLLYALTNYLFFKNFDSEFKLNIFFIFINSMMSYFLVYYYLINLNELNSLIVVILFSYVLNIQRVSINYEPQNINNEKINLILMIFVGLFLIINQSYMLGYETIDWDVNVFLAASQEIGRGNLPLESQFTTKPPLLSYLIYFITASSNQNLVFFKLFNDLLLLIMLYIMYKISFSITRNNVKSLLPPLIFSNLIEQPWATTEYSEYYILLFISISIYFFKYRNINKFNKFIAGLFVGLSSLVNFGSILFIIPLVFFNYFHQKKIKSSFLIVFGLFFPHGVFTIVYLINNLFDEYITSIYLIPKAYTSGGIKIIDSLSIFFEKYYENVYLYILIFILLFTYISNILLTHKFKKNNSIDDFLLLSSYFIISILFFYLAGKGYDHHLILFLYFLTFSVIFINKKTIFYTTTLMIFLSSSLLISENYSKSISNLTNLREISQSYPSLKIASFIESKNYSNIDILALDHTLVLYFLDEPNFSYNIHPANHYFPWITKNLVKLNKYSDNEISDLIKDKPEIIICLQTKIEDCFFDKNYYQKNVFNYENVTYYGTKNYLIYTLIKTSD